MKRFKKLSIVLILSGVVGMSSVAGAESKGLLDGNVFQGTMGQPGEKTGQSETISFKDGKFHSSACDAYGFGDGAYQASSSYGIVKFEADTANDKGAKIHWKGTVKNDKIEATSVMKAPGEKPLERWVQGELKK